ncbi:hypothetical protein F5Y01DRAFT_308886 [Xylaria sp. FL0043]|nr:hypothetical protein F5Y01DRAFT_308886 [Xylaria sp. FL0043]
MRVTISERPAVLFWELVKVAKSCLSTFNDLRHADIQERDQGDMQFHFIVQGLKFDSWCSSLGIQSMFEPSDVSPEQWRQKDKVKEFEDLLQSQLQFRSQNLAALVLRTLKSMEQRLSEAEKLMVKYAGSTAAQAPPTGTAKTEEASPPPSDVSTEDVNSTKRRIGNSISNVQWVETDKSTAQELLDSIGKVNDSLLDLVQSVLQAQIKRQTDLAVLENVDHHAHSITQSLPEGSDVRALASMKLWQVREQRESEDHASSTFSATSFRVDAKLSRPTTYSLQDFKRNTLRIGDSRSFSVLGSESVVVEWRYFKNDNPFHMEQSFRFADLIRLLNNNDLYKKFQVLPCKGYVTDNENSRVGMVFATGASSTTAIQSLQTVINGMERTPSVGERFDMARRLVLAIHNLHAVRWLHKGIRSDNVSITKKEDDLSSETGSVEDIAAPLRKNLPLTEPPRPLPPFYLLGWDLSRPDHPSELSESISVSTLGLQTKRETIRMYTHPGVFSIEQPRGKRPRYHARWDIYSIGLILLEIGLWRTIDTIRYGCRNDDEFRLRVRTEYCDGLQWKMGLVYWRAVQRCLNDDFDLNDEGYSGKDDYSLQVGFEKQVVFELERCFA